MTAVKVRMKFSVARGRMANKPLQRMNARSAPLEGGLCRDAGAPPAASRGRGTLRVRSAFTAERSFGR